MMRASEPSVRRRRLGRSRTYTSADLPERMRRWHAPRANRWEHLNVEAGALVVEWLDAGGVTCERLASADSRWIAPGLRWRIAQIGKRTRFGLEIHADDATAASAPQPPRAALLEAAPCVRVDGAAAFARALADLEPGTRHFVRGGFDFGDALRAAMDGSGGRLCWHPLHDGDGECVALVSRSARPLGLLEYLGRDHAVIEAALAGALRGQAEPMLWLRHALARHLAIEEDILFPAYLQAGGNAGWVRGLRNEHQLLRTTLEHLDVPASQRRFLLLLDGHDEKEEQIVYPDIVERLGDTADNVRRQVIALGAVDADSTAGVPARD